MNNKNTGIIATVASALTCGCCGLFMCIFGAVTATGNMPYTSEVNGIESSGMMPAPIGFAMLCLSIVALAIPVVVGFVTLRKKPEAFPSNEPIPPAS